MKTRLRMSLAVGFAVVSLGANAQGFFIGSDIARECTQSPEVAMGYVLGILDYSRQTNVVPDSTGHSVTLKHEICPPADATPRKAQEIVCTFLSDHPNLQSLPGSSITTFALNDAWPCT